jgi:hypothetical protein
MIGMMALLESKGMMALTVATAAMTELEWVAIKAKHHNNNVIAQNIKPLTYEYNFTCMSGAFFWVYLVGINL